MMPCVLIAPIQSLDQFPDANYLGNYHICMYSINPPQPQPGRGPKENKRKEKQASHL
jgi:hypothetical protein